MLKGAFGDGNLTFGQTETTVAFKSADRSAVLYRKNNPTLRLSFKSEPRTAYASVYAVKNDGYIRGSWQGVKRGKCITVNLYGQKRAKQT